MKKRIFTFSILLTLALFAVPNLASAQFCCCNVGGCQADSFALGCAIHCDAFGGGTAVPGDFPDATCGGNICAPLPVELEYFNIRTIGTEVQLQWKTASEIENKGFEIQRASGINMDWELVGFVDGNGTSTEAIEYSFIDKTPPPGTNYYRLKQVDFDGSETFSPVEAANLDKDEKIRIWPTLAKNQVSFSSNEFFDGYTISVFNMMGQKVIEKAFDHPTLDISELAEGHYIINIVGPAGDVDTLRFVKVTE